MKSKALKIWLLVLLTLAIGAIGQVEALVREGVEVDLDDHLEVGRGGLELEVVTDEAGVVGVVGVGGLGRAEAASASRRSR